MPKKIIYFVAICAGGTTLVLVDQIYAHNRSGWLASLAVIATLAVICGLWLLQRKQDSQ